MRLLEDKNTQLIMLGTGNAMVTKCYNTCFALQNGEEYFLVDAGGGNGILSQLEKIRISFLKIHTMFVTHGHTDHVLGVIWVIRKIASLMQNNTYQGDFKIYCHDELINTIQTFCQMTLTPKFLKYLGNRIQLIEVKDHEQVEATGFQLSIFDIGSTKAKQFGFQAILPDGQKLVCLGDEPYNKMNRSYVEGCDWLLCESFCLYADRDIFKPYEKHHSTALDAGKLAEELHIKNLVLYHTEDKNLSTRKVRYTEEAKQNFSGNVYVPDDLEIIEL